MAEEKKKFKLILSESQEIWLTKKELQVIAMWRDMKFGGLTITIKDGVPQHLVKVAQDIKLNSDDYTNYFKEKNKVFQDES